jgi:hypothetical protein
MELGCLPEYIRASCRRPLFIGKKLNINISALSESDEIKSYGQQNPPV